MSNVHTLKNLKTLELAEIEGILIEALGFDIAELMVSDGLYKQVRKLLLEKSQDQGSAENLCCGKSVSVKDLSRWAKDYVDSGQYDLDLQDS